MEDWRDFVQWIPIPPQTDEPFDWDEFIRIKEEEHRRGWERFLAMLGIETVAQAADDEEPPEHDA